MQHRLSKEKFEVNHEEGSMSNSNTHGSLTSSEREQIDINGSASPAVAESSQIPADASDDKKEEDKCIDNGDDHSSENAHNQLVLYDPRVNGGREIIPVSDPIATEPLRSRRHSFSHQASRVLPSVGAFTVQCANCFKWRLIPTKEKYEEIREHIMNNPFVCEAAREWRPDVSCDDDADIEQDGNPFVCEAAREWRPDVSCDDDADIEQDGSRLWAIDKPNIAQPPPGWQRLLRIRGEGSTKFADVYYESPSGKRLRSMVEIHRFLEEHPQYRAEGVTMDRFSFQIPRPLQEDYVRKKVRSVSSHEGKVQELGAPNPIAWSGPDENLDLNLGGPRQLTYEDPLPVRAYEPQKKKRTPSKRRCNGDPIGSSREIKEETLQL